MNNNFVAIPVKQYSNNLSKLLTVIEKIGATPIVLIENFNDLEFNEIIFQLCTKEQKSFQLLIKEQKLNYWSWFNQAVRFAKTQSKTGYLIFMNDDCIIEQEDLLNVFKQAKGSDLFFIEREKYPNGETQITNWFFGINLKSEIKADERYSWWYGGDAMLMDAINNNLIVKPVKSNVIHDRGMKQNIPDEFIQTRQFDENLITTSYKDQWKRKYKK